MKGACLLFWFHTHRNDERIFLLRRQGGTTHARYDARNRHAPLSIVEHSEGTAKPESILLALEEKPQGENGEWGDRAMSLCPHRPQLPAASQEHAHLLCVVSQLEQVEQRDPQADGRKETAPNGGRSRRCGGSKRPLLMNHLSLLFSLFFVCIFCAVFVCCTLSFFSSCCVFFSPFCSSSVLWFPNTPSLIPRRHFKLRSPSLTECVLTPVQQER